MRYLHKEKEGVQKKDEILHRKRTGVQEKR